jgi:hypothetical protein
LDSPFPVGLRAGVVSRDCLSGLGRRQRQEERPAPLSGELWIQRLAEDHTSLGRGLSNASLLENGPPDDESDKTLWPGTHIEFVRSLVAGGTPGLEYEQDALTNE